MKTHHAPPHQMKLLRFDTHTTHITLDCTHYLQHKKFHCSPLYTTYSHLYVSHTDGHRTGFQQAEPNWASEKHPEGDEAASDRGGGV